MAEAAAAQAVTATGALSLFSACKTLISSIKKSIDQVKRNELKVTFWLKKTELLSKLIEQCERKYNQCPWLDQFSQEELLIKLEYIKNELKMAVHAMPEKQHFYKAHSDKKVIDLLTESINNVDIKLGELKTAIDEILARPRRPSTAVSEVDSPLLKEVTNVKAKAQGQYIIVSWRDDVNSVDSIMYYNIYVNDSVTDTYDPRTSDSVVNYSAKTTTTFAAWQSYRVSITAVNMAGHEGYRSEDDIVLMNQSRPNGKPKGLKVVTALSRTSVLLSVKRPNNLDYEAMMWCNVYVRVGTETMRDKVTYEETDSGPEEKNIEFQAKNIDPDRSCQVSVAFGNEYGTGEQSEEIMVSVNSMKPSTPILSKNSSTSDRAVLEICTKANFGNVEQYQVYMKQGFLGRFEAKGPPVKPEDATATMIHPIDNLQPRKTYFFYVVSKSYSAVTLDRSIPAKSNIVQVKTSAA